jgi:hypothetical protein
MLKLSIHKTPKEINKTSGISRLGVLIFVLLVTIAVFVGNQVIPFYYYYYELLGLMESQAAKASVFSDAQIRKTITKKISELNIPINNHEDLKINRFGGKILIELYYEEVLFIEFGESWSYDLHTFKFNPRVERTY